MQALISTNIYAREASTKILEEKKRSLEESLCATKPEIWEKYQKLKEVEQETQCLLSEIRKRYIMAKRFYAQEISCSPYHSVRSLKLYVLL